MDMHVEKQAFSPMHKQLLGTHPRILEVNRLISRLAEAELTVLITGESGTGKDVAARLLHKLSPRRAHPFVKVNCPCIPEHTLESELFGYERGAFTGAHISKPGRFELAHKGTIFLDEICETPFHLQGKLVQILDAEPFMRVGGTTPVYSSARLVAAINVPLDKAVEEGRLREDISFRLCEVLIHMPPLREHRSDIPLLAEHFNYNISNALGKEYKPLDKDLLIELETLEYNWPGNVRELASRIKEYVATGSMSPLEKEESQAGNNEGPQERLQNDGLIRPREEKKFMSLKEAGRRAVEGAERALIEQALRYAHWNRRKAAKLLNTSYSSLLRRIESYKIGKS